MRPEVSQKPKLQLPSIRRWLLRVHSDLFTIHENVPWWLGHYPRELTPVEKLTLLLEDRRFLAHHGFDIKSLFRDCFRAATFRRHGGASTIDMQFVRTCTGYKQRTFKRKIYEIFLAVLLQFRYSKVHILRSYLACAFFGSKLKGSEAAARKLYGKRPDDLSVEEAAFLVSMLVYPRPLKPSDKWESRVQRRANYGVRLYVRYKERFDQLGS